MAYNIQSDFAPAFGLQQNGIVDENMPASADNCLNCQLNTDQSSLESRYGFQVKASGCGGWGLTEYNYENSDGSTTQQLISLGPQLQILNFGSLSVTYSGSNPNANLSILPTSSGVVLTLSQGGSVVLTYNMGKGFEESTILTIANLITAIDGVSNFSASATGNTATPCAFLDFTTNLTLPKSIAQTVAYSYFSTIPSFVTLPTPTANYGYCNNKNLLIITDGTSPKVYDGRSVCLAGLPRPDVIDQYSFVGTGLPSSGSSLTDSGSLQAQAIYYLAYSYIDYQGNVTYSGLSDALVLNPYYSEISLTIPCLGPNSGYNTNCAHSSSTQSLSVPSSGLVTITVSVGHTFSVNDTAYFLEQNTSQYIYGQITATTGTSLTVNIQSYGLLLCNLNSGDCISNNLQVNLYRSYDDQNTPYLVEAFPNDSITGFIQFTDSNIGAVVNGTQNLQPTDLGVVAITVNTTTGFIRDFQIGYEAFFLERNTMTYVSAVIVEVDPTTIKVAYTLPVLVNTGDVIANEAQTGAQWIFPSSGNVAEALPDADYCIAFGGCLLLAKGIRLYYSDETNNGLTTSGLSFPANNNEVDTNAPRGDTIMALAVNAYVLCIFGRTSIMRFYGTLGNGAVTMELITDVLGLVAPNAYCTQGDFLLFLSDAGVYTVYNGGIAATDQSIVSKGPISKNITPFFRNNSSKLSNAIMFNDIRREQIYIYVPSSTYGLTRDTTVCYDYLNERWYFWNNINIAGGALYFNNQIYWSERMQGPTLRTNLMRISALGTNQDFWDHTSSIPFMYETKWRTLNPSAKAFFKKPSRFRLYQIPREARDYQNSPTIQVDIYKDYLNYLEYDSFSITFGSGGLPWGFRWGLPFGSWQSTFVDQDLNGDYCQALKFKFTNNTGGVNTLITGFELEYADTFNKTLKG